MDDWIEYKLRAVIERVRTKEHNSGKVQQILRKRKGRIVKEDIRR